MYYTYAGVITADGVTMHTINGDKHYTLQEVYDKYGPKSPNKLKWYEGQMAVNDWNDDGKINDEAMTQALNKVLEDVPGLKPVQNSQRGFTQIGTGGNPAQNPQNPAQSKPTVASKRWNRWN